MLIVASAITVSVIGREAASKAQTLQTKTEEEAVKAVIAAMTEAFNRHDAMACAACPRSSESFRTSPLPSTIWTKL
jgi:hypothetical protein